MKCSTDRQISSRSMRQKLKINKYTYRPFFLLYSLNFEHEEGKKENDLLIKKKYFLKIDDLYLKILSIILCSTQIYCSLCVRNLMLLNDFKC